MEPGAVAQSEPAPVYFELHRPRTPTTGLRSGRWKLLVERRKRGERRILYDLEDDRGELRNVAKQHPEVLERLTAQAEAWREGLERGEAETRELTDPETLEQLRAMGYVE